VHNAVNTEQDSVSAAHCWQLTATITTDITNIQSATVRLPLLQQIITSKLLRTASAGVERIDHGVTL
jgi:hypothetical protein